MFDIGFWELVVVFIVALLAIRPENMPLMLQKTGHWIRMFKQTWQKMQHEIASEIEESVVQTHLKQAEQKAFKNLSCDIQQSLESLYQKAQTVQHPYQPPSDSNTSQPTGTAPTCPRPKTPPAS